MEKSINANDKEYKRLFIGIGLKDEVCSYFYDLTLKLSNGNKDIKPIPPKNIHITLKFLGNVKKSEINKVCKSIEISLKSKKTFKFNIKDLLDGFPRLSSARILYGVVGQGDKEVVELHYAVDNSLSLIGFEKDERKFIPHITIARMKNPVNITSLTTGLHLREFKDNICDKVILFESILSRRGSEYIIEKEFLLG